MSQTHNFMLKQVTETVEALRLVSATRAINSLTLTLSGGKRGGGASGEEGGGGGAGPCAWAGFIVSGASTHLAKDRLSTPEGKKAGEGYTQESGGDCAGEPPSPAKDAPLEGGGGEPQGGVVANIAPLGRGKDQVAAWLRQLLLPEEVLFPGVDALIPAST